MKHLILHSRQRKLLSILKVQQGPIASAELGKRLGVSDRTVRNDILYLKNVLTDYGASIQALRGKGYYLKLVDTALLQTLLKTGINLQTKEERARYLTLLLLVSDCGYRLGEVEDLMFISRTTLENDIRHMQSQYSEKPPFLKFIRSGHEIRCEDDERKRRILLSKLFVEEWDLHSRTGFYFREDLLEPEHFDAILEQVKQSLRRHEIKLDDYGMMDVVFSIAIARMRIIAGHILEETDIGFAVDSYLMNIINELIDSLEAVWHIRFNCAEREEIARTLQLRHFFDWKISTREDLKKYVNPSRIEVIEKLLAEIRDLYKVDLTKDDELLIGLVRHVISVVGRVRFRYERKSAVLQILKNEYPLVLDYALLFQSHFLRSFHYKIGEDELSFIAAYLLHALHRRYHSCYQNGIPTAFVSHLNLSASRVFMMQLDAIFGSNIDFKGPVSIYEEEAVMDSGSLFVLSTVQLDPSKVSIPGITISPSLEDNHILRIAQTLKDIRYQLFYPALPEPVKKYFVKDLFFRNLDADSQDEVIRLLASNLQSKGYVREHYAEAVLYREKISSTAFDCGIAIPHTIRVSSEKTAISVATLKKPIWWGSQKVQCVFLLAVQAEDIQYSGHFLHLGVRINSDRDILNKLSAAGSFEEFLEVFVDKIFFPLRSGKKQIESDRTDPI